MSDCPPDLLAASNFEVVRNFEAARKRKMNAQNLPNVRMKRKKYERKTSERNQAKRENRKQKGEKLENRKNNGYKKREK